MGGRGWERLVSEVMKMRGSLVVEFHFLHAIVCGHSHPPPSARIWIVYFLFPNPTPLRETFCPVPGGDRSSLYELLFVAQSQFFGPYRIQIC